MLVSFRKPFCLATLKRTMGKNVGFRRRSVVDEVRCLGAYSLIKRGSMGKHPTMIPVAISADLQSRSVCTGMTVRVCLSYDHNLTRPKSYPTSGFSTDRYSTRWHL